MAVHLPSVEDSKEIVEFNNLQDELKICASDTVDRKSTLNITTKVDEIDKEKVGNSDQAEEQLSKSLNVREIHETSPFKQAVKGFVLNKLSKKVGTSHLLSGITEKIVKKLEDKDNVQSVSVHNSESDLSISNLKIKEPSTEVISSSLSCELKSVVANDLALSEVLSIEDAIECVEEPKTFTDDVDIGVNIPFRADLRSNSISLPSSPAHRFSKRASSISSSLEDTELLKKDFHSPDLLFLTEEEKINDFESKLNYQEENEIKIHTITSNNEECTNSDKNYLHNAYSSTVNDTPKFKKIVMKKIYFIFSTLKNMFTSLSLSHIFLLASIVIHNIDILSSYIAFIFDGLVIAYIIYSYICILVQRPALNSTSRFPYVDPHLENASLHIQNSRRIIKGSAKILKGEFDAEMVNHHPTDLVDISIENCCLIIFMPKKKSGKDVPVKSESTSYDLLGASISLVPKDLSKKRVWNKKYPICIAFPCLSKKPTTPDNVSDVDSTSADYLSTVHSEDGDESFFQKALYIFALTDREKESLFWVLHRNTKDTETSVKTNEQLCDTSLKTDFSSMSYTSLLEMNSDDSLSLNKDVSEDENLSMTDKSNDVVLDFDIYMKTLFEHFERMNKFTSRSRSVEDISNLKEDISKSEFVMSKDDSFLSSSTCKFSVDWLSLALGRIFYDFLTQKYWSDDVKCRIQKKLDKIEMPTFIESLEVSDVYLGTSLPQIHTVSNPVADVNGVWFNFDFNYCGSFQMTLKTKLKMTKAKQLPGAEVVESSESKQNMPAISSESSDDEGTDAKISSTKKKKLINRIEKWISHKHFQTVAQNRFVKKYVGDLSNMPLTLTVELNTLHGTLTLNIPPAPTDRIWYGFRKDPVLSLNAYPKVGTHEINLSTVVKMIEKKLIQEFKKALVMPNMDDLLIPVMHTPIYDT